MNSIGQKGIPRDKTTDQLFVISSLNINGPPTVTKYLGKDFNTHKKDINTEII